LAYQNVLINTKTMIPLAEEKGFSFHIGIAKTLNAYVYLTLVDLFGDVPGKNALTGSEDFNPPAEASADVYAYALTLLDEAIVEFGKNGPKPTHEIYYNSTDQVALATHKKHWIALANTLKLKAWLNLSSSKPGEAEPKIAALLTQDLIDSPDENFTYKYGTATVPVSRHPVYNQYYGPTEASAGGYIGNYFLYELYKGKGVQDPRWRYYFYRQIGSIAQLNEIDPKALGCKKGTVPVYSNDLVWNASSCIFDPGFYGRDHGDASGTPPDSPVITAAGAYPVGGKLDTNPTSNTTFEEATVRGDGANGAGIHPIWMSFFTDFIKAEILIKKDKDVAGARAQLNVAIQNSIDQVRGVANDGGQSLPEGMEPSTKAYINAVNALYDDPATTVKTDVIGREFWVATWGNGIEAYNSYRRTSAPRNLPPPIQANPGPWLRAILYPSYFVNLNSTAVQKDVNVTNKVFWDGNAETLN